LARIAPHTGGKCDDIEKTLMIESAQVTLGGIKEILNHQRYPNKDGGMKKNPKDPKILS